jgi:hypothetical protein
VYGGDLPAPILLDDAAGNELLVSAPDIEPRAGVPREADRPVYELALFYIVPDLSGRTPAELRPDETGATGRFFPAVGELEPIFELGAVPGIGPRRDGGMTPTMLDYLAAYGVPVRSDVELAPERPPASTPATLNAPAEADDDSDIPAWTWALPGAAGALLLAAVIIGSRGRRRPRRPRVHF